MPADPPPSARLARLFEDAWEFQLSEFPVFATYAGDHRRDDKLESMKLADIERRSQVERGFLERLREIPTEGLARQDQLSRAIFERTLRDSLAEHAHRAYQIPITNREGFHVNFARLPDELTFHSVQDYRNYLSRLRAFPGYVAEHIELMRAGMREGRVLPRVTLVGIEEVLGAHVVGEPEKSLFYKPFLSFPAAIPAQDQESLRREGREAVISHVVPGFRSFRDFMLQEYVPGARESIGASALPAGKAFYEHRVRLFTTLDVSPEEVHAIGKREVERIRREMEAVLVRVGFRGTFAEFLESLRTDPKLYARSPGELLREASYIAKRMDGELPRLFKRLPRIPYGLRPVPDYIAPRTTSAYYNQPAGDGSRAGLYYLNTFDLKSRPLYALEALTFHEAVPGHHLQIALQQEIEGLPQFRRFCDVTAYIEGWALYAERLGLEVGFYQDPHADFGRLTYEMWRAARLVVDTGLHALGWSRDQAIELLASNTALSRHECTTEVDRYIAWPGQALAYKMGEIKMRELRRRAEEALGSRFDLREFHDVILRNGPLPLGLLSEEVEAWIRGQDQR